MVVKQAVRGKPAQIFTYLRKHSRGTLGYITHYNNTISLSLFTSWEHEAELESFDISHRSLAS